MDLGFIQTLKKTKMCEVFQWLPESSSYTTCGDNGDYQCVCLDCISFWQLYYLLLGLLTDLFCLR